MDVVCVGGGPAGLYFAICTKRRDPGSRVRVLERNPPGETFGWGVTFHDQLLDLLFAHDPQSAREIRARSVTWHDKELVLHGRSLFLQKTISGIERSTLLDVLTRRAVELGVELEYGQEVTDVTPFADADLVVAADGVNSRVRQQFADQFGTQVTVGRNRYAWLGTDRRFPHITFAWERTPAGWVWVYSYPAQGPISTCVVECKPETWTGLGLDRMPPDEGLRLLESLFERVLAGGRLYGGPHGEPARWLRFKHLTNLTWRHGNVVLMGDAAHAVHYTSGSGTRYAITDAATLAECLAVHGDIPRALEAYEEQRRPLMDRAVQSGQRSAGRSEDADRLLEHDAVDYVSAMRGCPDVELWRHRPWTLTRQLRPVRSALRGARVVRRWSHARRHWPDGAPPAAAPHLVGASSVGTSSAEGTRGA
ncbi:FAD-dependent monooxygenase [Geodermatophilus sp. SYSU D00705]